MNSLARKPAIDLATADGVTELEMHVRTRLGGQISHVELEITAMGIVLRGRARTYYAKQLAQHAVMEATPLPIVANDIDVC